MGATHRPVDRAVGGWSDAEFDLPTADLQHPDIALDIDGHAMTRETLAKSLGHNAWIERGAVRVNSPRSASMRFAKGWR